MHQPLATRRAVAQSPDLSRPLTRKTGSSRQQHMSKSKQVSFAVSAEMYDALELLAYVDRKTIADTIRRIVAKELVEYQFLDARAALTEQTSDSNGRFIPKARRKDPRPGTRP